MYGYFKDYFNLLELINKSKKSEKYNKLMIAIYIFVENQIKLDIKEYEKSKKKSSVPIISLLAKYIPKEGKKFDKRYNFVEKISAMMYPEIKNIKDKKKAYRKQIAILNKLLDVTEIKMSAGKFSEIVFSNITSKNAHKYRKAFLNLNTSKKTQNVIKKDRNDAREKFIQTIRDKKIKGGTLEVYDIVKSIIDYLYVKKSEKRLNLTVSDVDWEEELLKTQWDDMRKTLISKINKNIKRNGKKNSFSLDNLIPIVDVSGSMDGMPMYVAIGLGILVSEMCTYCKDRIITFSENPEWINLENLNIISSKWGANTNFEKVYKMLIDVVITKKLKESEIPNLIVFSDMQFDSADGGGDKWETHYANISKKFHNAGMKLENKPYAVPMIIFWNLRGDTEGFPVMKNTQNVKMLSGFSPNLLQYVLDENIESNIFDEVPKVKTTPYNTLRSILDDVRYDPIRKIVDIMIKAKD